MEIIFHVGDAIRKVRETRKLTKNQLADRIKLRRNSMGVIEKTGKCDTEVLKKIAAALDVPASFLIDNNGIQSAPLQPSICPDNNKDHMSYHEMLETILHCNEDQWKIGIAANLKAMSRAAVVPLPEGDHSAFSVQAPFLPGERYRVENEGRKRRRN